MKSRKIFLGSLLIAGILVTTIGLATGYGLSLPYITIDPIGNPDTGDLLILSGTTSLPAGTDLLVKVREEPGESGNQSDRTNTGCSARIIAQDDGPNRWSAPIDTSTLRPGSYGVQVTQMTWDHEALKIILGETSASSGITLAGEYLGSDPSQTEVAKGDPFFRIDPVGTKYAGDQFLVTGTTNLAVGSDVIWEVAPSTASNFPDTGTFSGMMANSEVTRGNGDENHVSLAVDTTLLVPGEYTVKVSNVVGDIYSPDSQPGDVSALTELILK
jgi:hypothetical protein